MGEGADVAAASIDFVQAQRALYAERGFLIRCSCHLSQFIPMLMAPDAFDAFRRLHFICRPGPAVEIM